MAQLEWHANNHELADALDSNVFSAMKKVSKKYPLYVNNFFMMCAQSFMKEIMKGALGIDHYWGRIEFAPGRSQIHLYMLGIARYCAYLNDYGEQGCRSQQVRP